jgi:WD40 repeat protein/serine/threonine protein kinase
MPCPSEEQIVLYLQRLLPPEAQRATENHIDQCAECRGLVVDLVQSSTVHQAHNDMDRSDHEGLFASGSRVDHFKILRLIGRGGMGDVYLARDTKLGRKVALKVVRSERIGSPAVLERFLLEAQTTARFSHPHIVTIYAVGEFEGVSYLALEYLEGQTLRQRLDEEAPRLKEFLRLGLAIAQALEEAHRHGVLHRDLKPANVIIPKDGRLRVVDFGLAKAMPLAQPAMTEEHLLPLDSSTVPANMLHLRGQSIGLCGTPIYMAPEQWLEEEATAATDLWAFGMILYELCAGGLPYQESSMLTLRHLVISPSPVPPLRARFELPPELHILIESCLQKDPQQRPPASQAVVVLASHLAGSKRLNLSEEQSPYRGLQPFGERDADLFFGRDLEIAAFLERLRGQPLLPVVGPSGAGKSSFVQAGVIPRLLEQGSWRIIRLRPGSQPFLNLAARLCASDSTKRTPGPTTPSSLSQIESLDEDRHSLARQLAESPALLGWILQQLAEQEQCRVLLFVDQLEEIYAHVPSNEDRRAFLQALFLAADEAQEPVRLIFTLRDDFLGRLAQEVEAREALKQFTVLLRPGGEQLREMVCAPLTATNYEFDDATLVEEMIGQVKDEPACLSLLQFVAQLLWERRDQQRHLLSRQAFEPLGGVAGALALHADRVLASLSPQAVSLARGLILRLVTPERTRQILSQTKLLEGHGPAAEEVLQQLIQGRLITVQKGEEGSEAEVELVHESLINTWHRLTRWIEESGEERAFLTEVSQAAELWQKRGRRVEELWRGDALREGWRAAQRFAQNASPLVKDFLEIGRQREQHEQDRLRRQNTWRLIVLGLLAVVAVLVAISYAHQKQQVAAERDYATQQRAEALGESGRAALWRDDLLEARAKVRLALESSDSALNRAIWWRLSHQAQLWKKDLAANIYDVAFSPDGHWVAAACQDKSVYLLHTATLQTRILRGHEDQVMSVSFSPDGQQLASGAWDGSLRVWELGTGGVRVLHGHSAAIWRLAFSPDGRTLATASWDKSVKLWDLRSSDQQARTLTGHKGKVSTVAFSPDGKWLVSAGEDQQVLLWNMARGLIDQRLSGHLGRIYAAAFAPDGALLATAGVEQKILLWQPRRSSQVWRSLQTPAGGIYGLSFDPRGSTLAAASWDGQVYLFSLEQGQDSGRPFRVLHGHAAGIYRAVFSPDGRQLVSGGVDKSVRLWSLTVADQLELPQGQSWDAWGVAFSPDGARLATGGRDKLIRLWDRATGREQARLEGHADLVTGLVFSPDGHQLASASADKTVRL